MSATILENPYIQDLSSSYGPMLVGTALSWALWGISCMQVFLYTLHYEDDPVLLKIFVYAIWLVETVSESLLIAALWPTLIANWGSLAQLGRNQLASLHRVWVVCAVTFVVQMYYFYRIYRFSGKRWLIPGLLLIPFVLWQLVMPVILLIWCMQDLSYANLLSPRIKGLEISLRASNAVVDIVIMGAMIKFLLRHNHSEFRRTQKMLNRLVIITVNTGLWTAVVAIIDLILVVALPNGVQYCVVEFPIGALYVNAFLANMNSRAYVRGASVDYNSIELEQGNSGRVGPSLIGIGHNRNRSMAIHVETETTVNELNITADGKGSL